MAPINFCNRDTAEFLVGDKILPNISILWKTKDKIFKL